MTILSNKLDQIRNKVENELSCISSQVDRNTADVLMIIDELITAGSEQRKITDFSDLERRFLNNNKI